MEDIPFKHADVQLTSRGARAERDAPAGGVLLLFPNVLGVKRVDEARAVMLRDALGVSVVAVDLFGEAALPRAVRDGDRAAASAKAFPLMNALLEDRHTLRARLALALKAAREFASGRGVGPSSVKAAAIGFCFGGACVLEMVRAGLDVSAVSSLHGTIDAAPLKMAAPASAAAPTESPAKRANVVAAPVVNTHTRGAKVLVCTGVADPLVPREKLLAFEDEMREAVATHGLGEWSVLAVGGAKHAFTDSPLAQEGAFGGYHEVAARQSWNLTLDLLRETFPTSSDNRPSRDEAVDAQLWSRLTKL